ncbi:CDP-diacylglycerol--glycerol-3-phosphate 3-phosphatidyltransferase [Caloramator mitchellensis]|uniref:CDP-diacylglycerol--glycerol-3-phosphate 3-phosphatidyltransferase n=1 Tax=Caloramator mitchellensis TaxID=908809 RepID=A0A0R3K2C5_CALMK|nr:CDP-alcohol phosphatidyltransferase family protein [Caloramator mitchellensis]KRQ86447.1 CDP-diacylglycerol--glycerol-3-phosphate 3-phosphatidyltransferase [Caloramator mitchellensis]
MNIPNALTLIRFLLVPFYLYIYFSGFSNSFVYAMLIFFVAGVTDVLDGFIARRFNMITKWGTLLDPLADKIMLLTVLFSLSYTNIIPHWVFFIVFIKEALMIIGGFTLFKKHETVIAAKYYGKAATVLFYLAIGTLIYSKTYGIYLLYCAIFLAFFALYNYLVHYMHIKKQVD